MAMPLDPEGAFPSVITLGLVMSRVRSASLGQHLACVHYRQIRVAGRPAPLNTQEENVISVPLLPNYLAAELSAQRFSQTLKYRRVFWVFFCGKSSDPLPKQTQGTATNPRLIQVWSGSGQTLGHRFAYDAVKSEQHGATLHYPFSWDEGDGTGSHDF